MNQMKLILAAALTLAAVPTLAAQKAPPEPTTLDRPALLKLADDYFGALVAHDPKKVPLADDIKVVENVKRIKAGEGLWKSATSGPTQYRIVAADPVSQQVGGLVILGSDGKPVQFGFRLKVTNGKVVEAEHLVVAIRDPASPNLQAARPAFPIEIPFEYADSRGRMVHIAKSYYDALDENNGHLAPFASDCERRENGFRTAPFGGPSLGGSGIPGATL